MDAERAYHNFRHKNEIAPQPVFMKVKISEEASATRKDIEGLSVPREELFAQALMLDSHAMLSFQFPERKKMVIDENETDESKALVLDEPPVVALRNRFFEKVEI